MRSFNVIYENNFLSIDKKFDLFVIIACLIKFFSKMD